jgi:leucyl-tRNA synthetase
VVQINGKKRDIISVNSEDNNEGKIIEIIRVDNKLRSYLQDKKIIKIIFVKSKLINLVTD